MTIFCDRIGLEVFASDGLTYVPMPFISEADNLSLAVGAKRGSARITSLTVYELRSAWTEGRKPKSAAPGEPNHWGR